MRSGEPSSGPAVVAATAVEAGVVATVAPAPATVVVAHVDRLVAKVVVGLAAAIAGVGTANNVAVPVALAFFTAFVVFVHVHCRGAKSAAGQATQERATHARTLVLRRISLAGISGRNIGIGALPITVARAPGRRG